jgi:hypothetical protein
MLLPTLRTSSHRLDRRDAFFVLDLPQIFPHELLPPVLLLFVTTGSRTFSLLSHSIP